MDFKKRLIEKLDLSPLAANTMYQLYIDVCEEVAKEYALEYHQEQVKILGLSGVSKRYSQSELDEAKQIAYNKGKFDGLHTETDPF